MEELTALAKRLPETGDEELATHWLTEHSYVEHPEAAHVRSLLQVLDEIVPRDSGPER